MHNNKCISTVIASLKKEKKAPDAKCLTARQHLLPTQRRIATECNSSWQVWLPVVFLDTMELQTSPAEGALPFDQ